MAITRTHMEAILSAAEEDMAHIPTTGIAVKPRGFSLDREQVGFLREMLSGSDADDVLLNEPEACIETVQDWLEGAKLWKLKHVIAACEAALVDNA